MRAILVDERIPGLAAKHQPLVESFAALRWSMISAMLLILDGSLVERSYVLVLKRSLARSRQRQTVSQPRGQPQLLRVQKLN